MKAKIQPTNRPDIVVTLTWEEAVDLYEQTNNASRFSQGAGYSLFYVLDDILGESNLAESTHPEQCKNQT